MACCRLEGASSTSFVASLTRRPTVFRTDDDGGKVYSGGKMQHGQQDRRRCCAPLCNKNIKSSHGHNKKKAQYSANAFPHLHKPQCSESTNAKHVRPSNINYPTAKKYIHGPFHNKKHCHGLMQIRGLICRARTGRGRDRENEGHTDELIIPDCCVCTTAWRRRQVYYQCTWNKNTIFHPEPVLVRAITNWLFIY